ncbi:MAG TPA: nuclear transport factor 2 family protein [Chitinophagaceae bacterium]|nr:nuclear transport factor 2 family protein [Chitinophagaceae bacterium]
MSKYLCVIACFFFANALRAQSAEDSVKAVINKMFIAMKDGDSTSLRACFADAAILQTVAEKDVNVSVVTEPLKEFADFVATQKKGDADERITFDIVKTNGSLAIAWTPYQFYYKGQFSHCGVDSYQLVRINGVWKIQYLIDTRRKDNCQ